MTSSQKNPVSVRPQKCLTCQTLGVPARESVDCAEKIPSTPDRGNARVGKRSSVMRRVLHVAHHQRTMRAVALPLAAMPAMGDTRPSQCSLRPDHGSYFLLRPPRRRQLVAPSSNTLQIPISYAHLTTAWNSTCTTQQIRLHCEHKAPVQSILEHICDNLHPLPCCIAHAVPINTLLGVQSTCSIQQHAAPINT